MTFGQWLKQARDFHDLTLEEVAEKSGTSKSYVWELEKDKSDPSLTMAANIAAVFGMELWRVLKKIEGGI